MKRSNAMIRNVPINQNVLKSTLGKGFVEFKIDEDGELCTTNHQYKQTNALLLHLRKVHKEEVHFHSVQGVPNTNSLHSKSSKRKPPTRRKLNKSRQQQRAESPILSSGDQTQESGPPEPEIPASPQDNIPIPSEIDSESTSKRSENVLTSQPTDPSTTTTSSTLTPHSTTQLPQSAPNPTSKTLEKRKNDSSEENSTNNHEITTTESSILKKQRINPSTQKFIDICNDIDSAHPPTPPKLTPNTRPRLDTKMRWNAIGGPFDLPYYNHLPNVTEMLKMLKRSSKCWKSWKVCKKCPCPNWHAPYFVSDACDDIRMFKQPVDENGNMIRFHKTNNTDTDVDSDAGSGSGNVSVISI
ncbi:hypothetical protein EYC84_000141 [Monilinia fructicola]|uniref:Uncharacterized protein n=1 Tax=Monilinia fructicola TaxID=38448 RepID=A0A5M9JSC5_MONFR|nr:hypothetical protein EYC84_000141 [Monilinia fructicola]